MATIACNHSVARAETPLIVFAGGGTGGHLYPALAVADALRGIAPGVRFVFFGTQRRIDRDVLAATDHDLVPQDVRPLTGRPWRWPSFVTAWRASVRRCRDYFQVHRPAMVIGTGGFASGPAVWAAGRLGVPTALINPDVIPGRANRFLSSRVNVVFAAWPESEKFFARGVVVQVTGCPLRSAFAAAQREDGLRLFALSPMRRTLLVTGASSGAQSVNAAMILLAAEIAALKDWQILHLTGAADEEVVRGAYRRAGAEATCVAYTEQMAAALAAADLVVARAGASTVAEIAAMGKPSVLLPYPHHRDRHQEANASVLVERGAAALCRDAIAAAPTAQNLRRTLLPLMRDQRLLEGLARQATVLTTPHAAEIIVATIVTMTGLAGETGGLGGVQKMRATGRY